MLLPLRGKTILLTRQPEQGRELEGMINEAGGNVVSFPMIRITGPADWRDCDRVIKALSDVDWIVFTSVHSVQYFLDRCREIGQWPGDIPLAAIGSKTAREIEKYGLRTFLSPEDYTAQGLLLEFNRMNISGKRFLLPGSDLARPDLADGLQKAGNRVDRVVVYRNVAPEDNNRDLLLEQLQSIDGLVFYSPSAIRNFIDLVGARAVRVLNDRTIPIAVIGPTTAGAAEKNGFKTIVRAGNSTSEALVTALGEWFQRH